MIGRHLYGYGREIHHSATSTSTVKDQLDPFSLVADELSILADSLRDMVVAEVPKLASAAEYFFEFGVEGKRFRPTVLLLMATALHVPVSVPAPVPPPNAVMDIFGMDLRARQQCIAEITDDPCGKPSSR